MGELNRQCGECTLCCELMNIKAYDSPMYEPCKHCDVGSGCSIHKTRDEMCRNFQCGWLMGEMHDEDRPDRAGFLIEHLPDVPVILAITAQGRNDLVHRKTAALRKQYVDKGIAVVVARDVLLPVKMTSDEAGQYISSAAKAIGVL